MVGSIPSELAHLRHLGKIIMNLNLSKVELRAIISWLYANVFAVFFVRRVVWLDVGDNELRGTLPSELGQLHNLGRFIVFENQLIGSIPSEIVN